MNFLDLNHKNVVQGCDMNEYHLIAKELVVSTNMYFMDTF